MAKVVDLVVADFIHASDHYQGTVERGGVVVGFSETPRSERAASGTQHGDGSIEHTFSGPTPTNEVGTMETCRTLVSAKNRNGANWSEPRESKLVHTDAEAAALNTPGEILRIQVVRAIADASHWRTISNSGKIRTISDAQVLAAELRNAIEHKARKIPAGARTQIVLALSALDSPAHAFDAVVDGFRASYGPWASSLGFDEIWVVGPDLRMTHRLDWSSETPSKFRSSVSP